ncbi:hypothetical protein A2U01_0033337 [Trifolium medium]|uniref:Uncharacterized protein n=1 Tax=Trifolium medium TaxID=97028 RepID=A0A392PK91_9FABA|nr:hypothetical protein [Trifolium medium]
MDRVLTPQMLETRALYPWLMASNYMTWYIKNSHPYLEPLPPGDPPRSAELDAIIHEEAEADGHRMATFVTSMLDIRQLIRASGVRRVRSLDGEHLQVSPFKQRTLNLLAFWIAKTGVFAIWKANTCTPDLSPR